MIFVSNLDKGLIPTIMCTKIIINQLMKDNPIAQNSDIMHYFSVMIFLVFYFLKFENTRKKTGNT